MYIYIYTDIYIYMYIYIYICVSMHTYIQGSGVIEFHSCREAAIQIGSHVGKLGFGHEQEQSQNWVARSDRNPSKSCMSASKC